MPIDISGAIYAQFETALKRGDEAVERGNTHAAAAAYRECSQALTQYAQYTRDPVTRAKRLERAQGYAELAAKAAAGKLARAAVVAQVDGAAPAAEDYTADIEALITRADTGWDDIGGLEQTKREIKTAYGIAVARRPSGVTLKPVRNMLFYGPPGTGKTLLAAATSHSLDAAFFNVKISNLLSKYFGESSKLITTLYAVARSRAPAVVFIDEVEALIPPRGGGNESSAERRVTTTLLVELDGLQQKSDDRFVLTIGATNLPWLIDKAMLSRFERKVYIPLPDLAAREAILAIQIDKQGYASGVPLAELARRTDGLSGREIERACKQVVDHMIGRVNPDLLDHVEAGRDALSRYQLKIEPLSADDIEYAFGALNPETTDKDLRRFEEWQKGE